MNARIQANTEYAKEFKKEKHWHELKINKKYLTFPMGPTMDEISLDMDGLQFAETLIRKFENTQRHT